MNARWFWGWNKSFLAKKLFFRLIISFVAKQVIFAWNPTFLWKKNDFSTENFTRQNFQNILHFGSKFIIFIEINEKQFSWGFMSIKLKNSTESTCLAVFDFRHFLTRGQRPISGRTDHISKKRMTSPWSVENSRSGKVI